MMSVHVRVSGRVQGVYYRAYTRDRAKSLGINGWVRNIPGGGVEAVLEGERRQVGELLRAMKSGPSGSVVLGMELSEIEAKGYNDFEIKY
ncbi:MAG: acylphosphatase [Methanothrix sp.]|jgi:acylphosphatase|uniref:acylphosphatase n=1 Tax=Methanothrix TaxID=2222 RepID=UPI0023F40E66|nr:MULTISPECIES: acylphosphatase [Methanothrix]MDQ1312904.1 acylphosphatase [Euryarchaeota archaeon]MCK9405024.1 acylphosphatase [Methanothrix sp.]MCK9586176.1 acylphosphatase [Methanothrix soehngenii]MDD3974621.1 acylphosphatase [Methanothrix soehngenii]MDD4487188.1 acylphosphatase [Methanothrix soehngenii]